MKRFLRLLLVCVAAAIVVSTSSVHAQATGQAAVGAGKVAFFTESTFYATLRNQGGISLRLGGYVAPTKKAFNGFPATGGSFDRATGQGEISTSGDLAFVSGSLRIDLRELQYQFYGTGPVVTAATYIGNTYMGRMVVYQVTSGNPFSPGVVDGTITRGNTYLTFDPGFATLFSNYFQLSQAVQSAMAQPGTCFLSFTVAIVDAVTP